MFGILERGFQKGEIAPVLKMLIKLFYCRELFILVISKEKRTKI